MVGNNVNTDDVLGQILDRAKVLYLTSNEQGRHQYTLDAICNVLQKEFGEKLQDEGVRVGEKGRKTSTIDKSTISRWVRKQCWDIYWEEAKRANLRKMYPELSDPNKVFENDTKFMLMVLSASKKQYQRNNHLMDLTYKILMAKLEASMPLSEKELQSKARGEEVRTVQPIRVSEIAQILSMCREYEQSETKALLNTVQSKLGNPFEADHKFDDYSTEELREMMQAQVDSLRRQGVIDAYKAS